MAEIDFGRQLWGFDLDAQRRQPLTDSEDRTWTLRAVAVQALGAPRSGAATAAGVLSDFEMRSAIALSSSPVPLTASQIAHLIDRVAEVIPPVLAGPAIELLERPDYDPLRE